MCQQILKTFLVLKVNTLNFRWTQNQCIISSCTIITTLEHYTGEPREYAASTALIQSGEELVMTRLGLNSLLSTGGEHALQSHHRGHSFRVSHEPSGSSPSI